MAKKKKNKLNKILKQQHLQQLSNAAVLPIRPASIAATPPRFVPPADTAPVALLDHHFGREIWQTVISLAVVALLLAVVVATHHHNNYLTTFGNWLYQTLRLK